MLISHKGHTDTIQVYSVTVMTHVKALQAGHSSQGTSEPITPVLLPEYAQNQRICQSTFNDSLLIKCRFMNGTNTCSDETQQLSKSLSSLLSTFGDSATPCQKSLMQNLSTSVPRSLRQRLLFLDLSSSAFMDSF